MVKIWTGKILPSQIFLSLSYSSAVSLGETRANNVLVSGQQKLKLVNNSSHFCYIGVDQNRNMEFENTPFTLACKRESERERGGVGGGGKIFALVRGFLGGVHVLAYDFTSW